MRHIDQDVNIEKNIENLRVSVSQFLYVISKT